MYRFLSDSSCIFIKNCRKNMKEDKKKKMNKQTKWKNFKEQLKKTTSENN